MVGVKAAGLRSPPLALILLFSLAASSPSSSFASVSPSPSSSSASVSSSSVSSASSRHRRFGLLRFFDAASDVSSALSDFVAEELATDDRDDIFSYPFFRDVGLPMRSLQFLLNALGAATIPASEEQKALREKAPNLEAMAALLRSDLPLLLPVALWIRSKMVDEGPTALLGSPEDETFRLFDAICDPQHANSLWPQKDDLGFWAGWI